MQEPYCIVSAAYIRYLRCKAAITKAKESPDGVSNADLIELRQVATRAWSRYCRLRDNDWNPSRPVCKWDGQGDLVGCVGKGKLIKPLHLLINEHYKAPKVRVF